MASEFRNDNNNELADRSLTLKQNVSLGSNNSARKQQAEFELQARPKMDAFKKTINNSSNNTSLLKGMRNEYVDQRYVKVIQDKIKSLWYNMLFVLIIVLFMTGIVTQAVIGYSKYITFLKLQKDIDERLISADDASLAVNKVVNLVMYIDLTNAVREGIIRDDMFSGFGTPSIIATTRMLSKALRDKMLYYSKKVDMNMVAASSTDIVDLGYFTKDQDITSYLIDFNRSSNNESIFWYKGRWGAKKFLEYTQPFIDTYIQIPKELLGLASTRQLESYLSLSLGESLLGYLISISETVKSYFVGTSQMSYSIILTNQISTLIIIACILVIVAAYCLALQLKMHWLYNMIFNFKVKSSHKAWRCLARGEGVGKNQGVHWRAVT